MKVLCILVVFALAAQGVRSDQTDDSLKNLVASSFDLVRTIRREVKVVEDGDGEVTGRGKKTNKILLPLIVGLKFAFVVKTALVALKVLALKSLLVSKFAVLVSVAVAAKYVYDKMHQPLYDVTPYASASYQHGYWAAPPVWSGGWSDLGGHAELSSGSSGLGSFGGAGDLSHLTALGGAAEAEVPAPDLQPHYSNTVYQKANYTAASKLSSTNARQDLYGIGLERKPKPIQPPKYKTTVYKTTVKRYDN